MGEAVEKRSTPQFMETLMILQIEEGRDAVPDITPVLSDNVLSQTNLWVKRRLVGRSEWCTKPTLVNQTF